HGACLGVESNAGERQKNNGLGDQAMAAGRKHVSQLVGGDGKQDNANQGHVAAVIDRTLMSGVIRPVDKHGKDQKSEVNASVYVKKSPHRNGPASHNSPLLYSTWMDVGLEAFERTEPCA